MAEKRLHITVSGKVQGVFFRKYTCEKALSLGLKGWVKNQPDGSVFVDVYGPDDLLQLFVAWCKQGPPRAVVTAIQLVEITGMPDTTGFEVRR